MNIERTIKNNEMPKVSIGIPIYNEEKWVTRALESLLAQSYPNIEFIISDNASTDRTGEICRVYKAKDKRVKYYCNDTNISLSHNYEKVVQLSQGKYFMWAAADDWWAPDFVKLLVEELERHPEAGLAMSAFHRYKESRTNFDNTAFNGTYFDSTAFEVEAEDNPNNMTFLQMLIAFATNIGQKRIPYHCFIYGLYRTDILKSLLEVPIPQVPAADRLFMCQVALATKIRYVNQLLHIRTIRGKPAKVRYSEEEFMRSGNTEPLVYTKVWLALTPYLWASKAIPDCRKRLIAVASVVFMRTFRELLYNSDVQSSSRYNSYEVSPERTENMKVIEQLKMSGNHQMAHEFASALALEEPDSVDLLTNLAELKYQIGDRKTAINILKDVIRDCPSHSRALSNLAVIHWSNNQKDEAISFATDALKVNENNIEANLNLTKMLLETGKSKDSIVYLEHILKISPQNKEAMKLLDYLKAEKVVRV